jgi:hypothetical protein
MRNKEVWQMSRMKKRIQFDLDKMPSYYSGTQELLDNEEGLEGYNRDIVKKIFRGLKIESSIHDSNFLLADFGAGTGSMAEIFSNHFELKPLCIEIDSILSANIREKGFECQSQLSHLPRKLSHLYSINVIEHIENDIQILAEMKDQLNDGGRIAIYVPAIPILYSDLDRNVGHYRRYTKRDLVKKLEKVGFVIDSCTYNDCIGIIANLAVRLFGYKNKMGLGSRTSLELYDRFVYPISKFLDALLFKFLIGKNLLVFAHKPIPN